MRAYLPPSAINTVQARLERTKRRARAEERIERESHIINVGSRQCTRNENLIIKVSNSALVPSISEVDHRLDR